MAYYVSSNEQDNILDIKPILDKLDGTRGYQFQSECCGVHDGSPMQYYDNSASNRGSRIDGFCPEYGTACLPVIESLRRMMPGKDLWPINNKGAIQINACGNSNPNHTMDKGIFSSQFLMLQLPPTIKKT